MKRFLKACKPRDSSDVFVLMVTFTIIVCGFFVTGPVLMANIMLTMIGIAMYAMINVRENLKDDHRNDIIDLHVTMQEREHMKDHNR